ncbi:MAG: phage tail protein [Rhizonema sp. NSF051]|nr:phage tail protein [Rhizonema sp. NSF051]
MVATDFEFLTANSFYIELTLDGSNNNIDGIFLECQGFQRTQPVIEICEVTPQIWGSKQNKGRVVRTKLPGNDQSGNITLRRGMTSSMVLWDWFQKVQQGKWKEQRQAISLNICNNARKVNAKYQLDGAWPTSYKVADVNASSTDFAIEELEIAFEEFKRVKA